MTYYKYINEDEEAYIFSYSNLSLSDFLLPKIVFTLYSRKRNYLIKLPFVEFHVEVNLFIHFQQPKVFRMLEFCAPVAKVSGQKEMKIF